MVPVWLTDTVTSDLNRALHYTQLWGLHGMELRTVGGADDRVPFVNEKQIRGQLEGTELLLSSVVPSMFEGPVSDRAAWMNDLLQFEDTLKLCRRVGCPRVTVSPFAAEPGASFEPMAEALQQAGEKAAEHDVLVAVRNGPETACPTGQALAELLSGVEAPNVRAAWNPVGALRAGEDPSTGLAALAGLVTLVRCSDGRVEEGRWADTPLGDGDVGWTEQLQQLSAQGFQGPISLEMFLEPRPKHGLRSATTLIRMIREVRASAPSG
ncbi:sugar phosphate isomerase/epimerase family protein [Salinibacter altiplanensis]|uniref:sugar phosphate isomerase/epimerase family protein n=1 Tax=Salinibacter altiplanensis TaxID=1803181 RepID=UPI000C9F9510|nr:sugar phosphate isomerase/epimerase family protein [Salinibacter altiplanensis]